ncbi:MAG: hydroxyacid dehydrogenase [Euryarchaeota archaeon]|nr:hydroxyacid dehydrogenase [Euryarchaeota archaeon]
MTEQIVSLRSVERIADAFEDVDLTVVPKQQYTDDELIAHAEGASGLFVHSENQYTSALFEASPDLRVIGRPGSGLDNIDLDAATANDIAVVFTPGMNAIAVAEFVVGRVISHIREFEAAANHVQEGGWRSPDWWGTELREKTVGIVGLGAAGYETAKRLEPFGVDFLVADPYVDQSRVDEIGGRLVDRDDLLAESDFVSLHVRLTEETTHMIDAAAFDRMKESAVLINTARGRVVDHDALVEALKNDRIGGAVIDVYPSEPPEPTDPIFDCENASVTPHLAGATVETRTRMLRTTAENMLAVLGGRDVDPQFVANPAVFDQ